MPTPSSAIASAVFDDALAIYTGGKGTAAARRGTHPGWRRERLASGAGSDSRHSARQRLEDEDTVTHAAGPPGTAEVLRPPRELGEYEPFALRIRLSRQAHRQCIPDEVHYSSRHLVRICRHTTSEVSLDPSRFGWIRLAPALLRINVKSRLIRS